MLVKNNKWILLFIFIRFINMVSNQSLYYNKISKQAKTIKANLSYEYCSYLRNKPTMRENFKQIAKLLNISNDSNIPEEPNFSSF